MRTQRGFIVLVLTVGLLLASALTALAVPPLPSSFYGTVKAGGSNVPIGTTVSAWINGVKYNETTVLMHAGDTVYSLDVPGDDSGTPDKEGGVPGDTVVFRVGTQVADQTAPWQSGNNVELNLTVTNDPPVSDDDTASTDEDIPVGIAVLANDSDVDGTLDPTTLTVTGGPSHGTTDVGASGTVTYTPELDYHGSDSFTYTVEDDDGAVSNEATVSVTVNSVNDPPVADAAGPYAGNQNQTVTLDGSGSSDPDGSLVNYEWRVDGSTVYSGPNPAYDLDLGGYGVGSHSILLTVTDDLGATDSDTTSLSVSEPPEPPNFRPRAVDDAATTDEETAVSIAVLDNDWDPDGVIVPDSLEIVDEPTDGSLTVSATGICTYTPDPDFNGSDSFSYRVQDDDGAWSNQGEVSITVNGVNDPPVADDDTASTDEDTPVEIDVLTNDHDVDGTIDPTTLTVTDGPTNGVVTVGAGGTVTYTPNADFYGSDSFSYTVEDDDGATSNEATVSITVNDVNDPPVAVDDETSTEQDTSVDIDCTTNDVDPDGTIDVSSMIVVLGPTNGSVTIGENGLVTYTPDAGYVGNDTFTYTVQDDDGATSNAATVIVNILAPAPEQHFAYMPAVIIGQ